MDNNNSNGTVTAKVKVLDWKNMEWKTLGLKRGSLLKLRFGTHNASQASVVSQNSTGSKRRFSRLSVIFGMNDETQDDATNGLDTIAEQDPAPSDEAMEELYKSTVLDKNRIRTPFVSLVRETEQRRTIVIFIRHFFCGNCFGYVRALAKELPPERLAQLTPPTSIKIIGCGDPVLIQNYIKMTDCPYEIYADPTRSLYKTLGFSVNLIANERVPTYVSRWSPPSLFKNIMISLGLAARSMTTNAGKTSQNGGELVWVDGVLEYTHRMKNTNDHLEIEQLMELMKR